MIDVLVVDDDVRVAQINAAYVAKVAGFRVSCLAHSASQALAALDTHHVDLILLDHYLPDETGLHLVGDLRRRGLLTDVIMVTAARDIATVQAAMRHGALQYLVKPFTFAGLRSKLEGYATLHRTFEGGGQAEQSEVDRIFGALGGVNAGPYRIAQGALHRHSRSGALGTAYRGGPAVRAGRRAPSRTEPADRTALPQAPGAHRSSPPHAQIRRNGSPRAPLRVGLNAGCTSASVSPRHPTAQAERVSQVPMPPPPP